MKWFKKACLVTAMAITPFAAFAKAWGDLNTTEQRVLKPLSVAWNGLSDSEQKTWLKTVDKLNKADDQKLKQAQKRMAEWAALSSSQRKIVSERIKSSGKNADERAQDWHEYIDAQ